MFSIIFSTLKISIPSSSGVTLSKSIPYLSYFLTSSFSSSSSSSSSSDDEETEKAHSFTLSYLINSCGLCPKSAIVAARKVRFQNPRKPDSVIAFLRAHGFSETQISSFVTRRPKFLLANTEKTLLPKLNFFYSKGLSKENIAMFVSSYPNILYKSLNNFIVPSFKFLKIFLWTDERLVHAAAKAFRSASLGDHLEIAMSKNVGLLRDLGFSDSNISGVLRNFPDIMFLKPERVAELVNKARDMGFVPEKYTFISALRVLVRKDFEYKWLTSCKAYERWGWSEDDFVGAVRYHPNCMLISEKKINKTMKFLVNEMGYPSKQIAEYPVVLFYSFEKRIFPRCSVLRILFSKGLVNDANLANFLPLSEKRFLDSYLTKYMDKVPLLLSVYEGKVDPKDV